MKRFWVICFLIPVLSAGLQSAWAEESGWPRTIPVEQGEVKVYAPQVETFENNTLSFRAALAWFETPDSEPVFGAGWFEADVVVDTLSRTVHPTGMDVVETRFPEGMERIDRKSVV